MSWIVGKAARFGGAGGFAGRCAAAALAAVCALGAVSLRAAPPTGPAPALAAKAPAVLPAPAATPTHALTAEDLGPWLDGLMPTALRTAQTPGAVVVVVKDGQVLLEKGYGYADDKKQTPVDPKTTLFRPGSVSKLFTWTAVMQLVEAGQARPRRRRQHLPRLQDPALPGQAGHPARADDPPRRLRGDRPRPAHLRQGAAAAGRGAEAATCRRASSRPTRARPIRTTARASPATSSSASRASRSTPTSQHHIFAPLGMTQLDLRASRCRRRWPRHVERLRRPGTSPGRASRSSTWRRPARCPPPATTWPAS